MLAKYFFCNEFIIFTGQYLRTVKIENFRHILMSSLRWLTFNSLYPCCSRYAVSWRQDPEDPDLVEFEMMGETDGWLALGLSEDTEMVISSSYSSSSLIN